MHFYKTNELTNLPTGIQKICFYDGCYFFKCEAELNGFDEISETDFDAVASSIASMGVAIPKPLDPPPSQLDRIEAKIQVNEDLQAFYDEIVQEVGL